MAKVTIQYWAAAKEAAGVAAESVEAETLAEALDVILARRADDAGSERLRSVLAASSFLVDGAPAGRSAPPTRPRPSRPAPRASRPARREGRSA